MEDFQFKEIDLEGQEILSSISNANNFNDWMFNAIKPWCVGDMLEIGSGIGNISFFFTKNGSSISLSDIRDNYCDILRNQFGERQNVNGVYKIDIAHEDFEIKYSEHLNRYDTVFALNIIEHIENDQLAIKNCKSLLKEGGNLIILVPAWPLLYNSFDKELQHYRRYKAKAMIKLMKTEGLKIQKSFYFNIFGIIGWVFFGSILKRTIIAKAEMGVFNKLVPVIRFFDYLFFKRIGLSVVTIARKKNL